LDLDNQIKKKNKSILVMFLIYSQNFVQLITSLTFKRSGYNTILGSILFITIRLPCFNTYYQLFYVSDKKRNIINIFTRVSLAHWIICDGSKQNKGLHLNTYDFDLT
jgi:hypothetical protein